MRKLLILLLLIVSRASIGQINPTNGTVSNKSYSPAQSVSTDFRSWFYDGINFIMRDYNGTSEVIGYLNLSKYRSGHFPIFVHSGGTLNGNGTYTGGVTLAYWFKDGTADGNLVRWYTDSTIITPKVDTVYRKNDSVIGFTIDHGPERTFIIRGTAAGGSISSLVFNAPGSIFNTPINFANASGAWSGSMTLLNQNPNSFLAGPSIGGAAQPTFRQLTTADLPTSIPNGNLLHSSIGFSIGTSGTSPNWSLSSPALGGSTILNIPIVSTSATGIVTPTLFNFWNQKVDSTIISNDSVYEWRNGTRFFRYIVSSGGGAVSSVSNSDGSLTISPTTGVVIASLNTSHVNTWTGSAQVFNGGISMGGPITFQADNSYSIGSGSAAANAVFARFLHSTGSLTLISASATPIVFNPGSGAATVQFLASGQVQLVNYNTSTSFTGTPLAYLQTDASGNIIQIPIASVQGALTLTTTGSSGAATLIGTTLNIPQYSGGGGGITQLFGKAPVIILGTDTVTVDTTTGATHLATQGYVGRQGFITLTSLSASSPLSYNNTTGAFTIQVANTSQSGYLSSTDWNTFNGKQSAISLTTTGTSGAATFISNTLNIPQYQGAITLTTTGTSGAATLIGTTLNIPQYSGGAGATNIGSTQNATNYSLTSSTGSGTTLLTATTSLAGLLDTARARKIDSLSGKLILGVGTFSATSILNGGKILGDSLILGPADASNFGGILPSGSQTLGATLTLTHQLTVVYSGSTNVMGNNFIGTQSASDFTVFTNARQNWQFKQPTASYDAGFVIAAKGIGSTDSCDYMLTARPVSLGFPVAMMLPTQPHKPMSLDIIPSDSVSYLNNGRAWIDVCNRPLPSGAGYVATLRLQADSLDVDVGSAAFASAPLPNLNLIYGIGNRIMRHTSTGTTWTTPNFVVNEISNAYNQFSLLNTDAGSSAAAAFVVGASSGSGSNVNFYYLSGAGYSSSPFLQASGGLYAKGATKLVLLTNQSQPVMFGTNNTERGRVDGGGSLLWNTTTNIASSLLTIASTTQGILIPRMNTTQQNAISSPATGLVIYNTDSTGLVDYTGAAWLKERAAGGGGSQTWQQTLTTGSTLNTTNTITNTGQSFTWNNGGTGTFKLSGILTDTVNAAYVLLKKKDSSVAEMTFTNLAAYLPSDTLNADNGLVISGTGLNHTISLIGSKGNRNVYGTDGSGNASWTDPVSFSGSWTVSASTNVATVSLTQIVCSRNGLMIHVTLSGSVTATLTATASAITVNLPSGLQAAATTSLSGFGEINPTGISIAGAGVSVTSSSTALIQFVSTSTSSVSWVVSFDYYSN